MAESGNLNNSSRSNKFRLPASRSAAASVTVLAPLPPPVTGMTLLTEQVVHRLQSAGEIKLFNWSPKHFHRGVIFRLLRTIKVLSSLVRICAHGRVENENLYVVGSSKAGLYLTGLIVWLATKLGYALYLHHHVYSYIDKFDWRMAWIDRCLGGKGVHIVHSEKMAEDFNKLYSTRNHFLVVAPSVLPIEIGFPRPSIGRPIRLGMLSNLSLAKGLDLTIEVFKSLRTSGQDVTLTLAGPAVDAKSRQLIRQATMIYSDRVQHIGPVANSDKARFFADIDVFLFPTQSESWGLVLNESMGAGVPVITFDRGCTSNVVGAEAGLVIHPKEPFVDRAVSQIERWITRQDEYRRASNAAIEQAKELLRIGQSSLDNFVNHIFCDGQISENVSSSGALSAANNRDIGHRDIDP